MELVRRYLVKERVEPGGDSLGGRDLVFKKGMTGPQFGEGGRECWNSSRGRGLCEVCAAPEMPDLVLEVHRGHSRGVFPGMKKGPN